MLTAQKFPPPTPHCFCCKAELPSSYILVHKTKHSLVWALKGRPNQRGKLVWKHGNMLIFSLCSLMFSHYLYKSPFLASSSTEFTCWFCSQGAAMLVLLFINKEKKFCSWRILYFRHACWPSLWCHQCRQVRTKSWHLQSHFPRP